jgi:tRNA1(Val) A37 N6-methylase TrmN6
MQSPASSIILAVAQNGLAERVAVYPSDNLDSIPAFERWDLVVGNPPHFSDISPGELRFHDEG